MERKYSETVNYEKKLKTIMKRLGVERFDYDWSRKGSYVEMVFHGRAYRFENSMEKAASTGRKVEYVSDIFAEIVLSLEGLARATEKDIFTLDMLLSGVPSLPANASMPECFVLMGLDAMPDTVEAIKKQYRAEAKKRHPDNGGSAEDFCRLEIAYKDCLNALGEQRGK